MLKAGYARADITPPVGCLLSGYYEPRIADGILDPLFVRAVAFDDGSARAILFQLDVIGIPQHLLDGIRARIAENLNLDPAAILVHCSHTHTGPVIADGLFNPDLKYNARLEKIMEQAGQSAIDDLKEASILTADGEVHEISFIRRFRMKDGTTRTNPGRRNPDIAEPIGLPDEQLQLARIVRPGADEILLINFQVHPDTIGSYLKGENMISADYPGFVVRTLEGALPGIKAVYLNGASGNLNHINVNAPEWDANSGYEHTAHMGRSIAGEVLRIYTKARPICSEGVRYAVKPLESPANKGPVEKLPYAAQIVAWHNEGRDDLIPETGMGITTLVAEATRMLRLKDAPDCFILNISALSVGGLCISGVPGEPFTEIGQYIKANSPFAMQMVVGQGNGYEGYYPMKEAFDEGGYEARSSSFKGGIAESIAEAEAALARSLKEE